MPRAHTRPPRSVTWALPPPSDAALHTVAAATTFMTAPPDPATTPPRETVDPAARRARLVRRLVGGPAHTATPRTPPARPHFDTSSLAAPAHAHALHADRNRRLHRAAQARDTLAKARANRRRQGVEGLARTLEHQNRYAAHNPSHVFVGFDPAHPAVRDAGIGRSATTEAPPLTHF